MAVHLYIEDGNPPYYSPSIHVRATTDPSGPVIIPKLGRDNYIFTLLENRGTIGTLTCTSTGPFVTAEVIEPGTGNNIVNNPLFSHAQGNGPIQSGYPTRTTVQATFTPYGNALTVKVLRGTTVLVDVTFPPNSSSGWGYSPDGNIFLLAYGNNQPGGTLLGYVNLYKLGNAPILTPTYSYTINDSSSGWGFSPAGSTFLMARSSIQSIDLYSMLNGSHVSTDLTSPYGAWRFSPCGDICALIGRNVNDPVTLIKLPPFYQTVGHFQPTSGGQLVSLFVTGFPATLQVNGQGRNGIALSHMTYAAIDNPFVGVVEVDVYSDVPSPSVSRSHSTLVGRAFADLPAGRAKEVLILPAWHPTTQAYYCLVAESFTLDSSEPLPSRDDDFHVLALDQTTQRNVGVITSLVAPMRSTDEDAVNRAVPQYEFPFVVQNPTNETCQSKITVEKLDYSTSSIQDDLLLGTLPKGTFESSYFGFLTKIDRQEFREHARDEVSHELNIELQPGEMVEVNLAFDNISGTGSPSAQSFSISELRNGDLAGGIIVVGLSGIDDLPGKDIPLLPHPSPIVLDNPALTVKLPSSAAQNTSDTPKDAGLAATSQVEYLNVSFSNPTFAKLSDARCYLESLSAPDAQVTPGIFYVSQMGAGSVINANWQIDFSATPDGNYLASFVVQDSTHDYKRILTPVTVTRAP